MAKRVEIRLGTSNPANNDSVSFDVIIPSMFWNTVTVYQFKTVTTYNKITIGATLQDTIDNFYAFLIDKYSALPWITVTKVDNGCNILFNVPDLTNTFNTIVGALTFAITEVTVSVFTRDNIILTRSPYNYFVQPTMAFDSAVINLKVYRGTRTTDSPINATFTLSKSVIQAGQTKINFEIGRLVNDYVKNSMPTFGGVGVHTSTIYDSCWIDLEVTIFYLGTSLASTTAQYLAIDGFGYHTQLFNPKLIKNGLTTLGVGNIFYLGSDYPFYFVSKGLVGITINGTAITYTLDSDINNQIIAYINLGAYATAAGIMTVELDNGVTREAYSFTVKDVCKFPLYNCFFKNKYGVWQSIPFNLRSKTTATSESTDYSPIVSTYGQYSLMSHNKRTYMPMLKETIIVNTDYIPESYNDLFDELLLSEFVYLENNGQYLPVNVNSKSLEKKTKTFDKMIQYTMTFDYSFNKMNIVY